MSKLYNKYRSDTIRLKSWDYTNPWWYFITICTNNFIEYFGKIRNGKMHLSPIGNIVEREWLRTEKLRDYIELDYYVIMPNHLHGIIIINESDRRDVSRNVSTNYFSKISPKPASLSSTMRAFKGSVTRECNKNKLIFKWQPKFYDRIIRNEKELFNIRKYIDENPLKWEGNRNPENLALV